MHDSIPSLKREGHKGEKLQQHSPQPSHRLSLAQPITYIVNLLDRGNFTNMFADISREKGTEKKSKEDRKKINARLHESKS